MIIKTNGIDSTIVYMSSYFNLSLIHAYIPLLGGNQCLLDIVFSVSTLQHVLE